MDIKKLINLIEKTGDRCVVVDTQGNPEFVIMSFSAYEKVIDGNHNIKDLSEEELLEKINCEVATWRESQNKVKLQEFDTLEEALKEEKEEPSEEKYYFEPVE